MDSRAVRSTRKSHHENNPSNSSTNTTLKGVQQQTKGNLHTQDTTTENEEEVPIFIQTLVQIVEHPDTQHLCHWTSAGNTFIIEDPEGFADVVLSKHFKSTNFTSFVRQLNFYGFRKASKVRERNHWEFQHSHFVRGRNDLIQLIRRKTALDYSQKDELETVKSELETLRELLGQYKIGYSLARKTLIEHNLPLPEDTRTDLEALAEDQDDEHHNNRSHRKRNRSEPTSSSTIITTTKFSPGTTVNPLSSSSSLASGPSSKSQSPVLSGESTITNGTDDHENTHNSLASFSNLYISSPCAGFSHENSPISHNGGSSNNSMCSNPGTDDNVIGNMKQQGISENLSPLVIAVSKEIISSALEEECSRNHQAQNQLSTSKNNGTNGGSNKHAVGTETGISHVTDTNNDHANPINGHTETNVDHHHSSESSANHHCPLRNANPVLVRKALANLVVKHNIDITKLPGGLTLQQFIHKKNIANKYSKSNGKMNKLIFAQGSSSSFDASSTTSSTSSSSSSSHIINHPANMPPLIIPSLASEDSSSGGEENIYHRRMHQRNLRMNNRSNTLRFNNMVPFSRSTSDTFSSSDLSLSASPSHLSMDSGSSIPPEYQLPPNLFDGILLSPLNGNNKDSGNVSNHLNSNSSSSNDQLMMELSPGTPTLQPHSDHTNTHRTPGSNVNNSIMHFQQYPLSEMTGFSHTSSFEPSQDSYISSSTHHHHSGSVGGIISSMDSPRVSLSSSSFTTVSSSSISSFSRFPRNGVGLQRLDSLDAFTDNSTLSNDNTNTMTTTTRNTAVPLTVNTINNSNASYGHLLGEPSPARAMLLNHDQQHVNSSLSTGRSSGNERDKTVIVP